MAMESGTCYVSEDIDKATELRLGLPGTDAPATTGSGKGTKRAHPDDGGEFLGSSKPSAGGDESTGGGDGSAPPAKQQVVGWPPIRSYRKNNVQAKKVDQLEAAGGILVKVSMDGAPYLRKIDLKVYKGYKELRDALDVMFKCFSQGSGNYMERSEIDFAMTYEDKDGDWMLVGDVPWEMFTSSCKRLRIMRGSEARGYGTTGR